MNHADIDAHQALADTPSWGTSQGRDGDEYRLMNRSDLGLAIGAWAASWVLVFAVGCAIARVFS